MGKTGKKYGSTCFDLSSVNFSKNLGKSTVKWLKRMILLIRPMNLFNEFVSNLERKKMVLNSEKDLTY